MTNQKKAHANIGKCRNISRKSIMKNITNTKIHFPFTIIQTFVIFIVTSSLKNSPLTQKKQTHHHLDSRGLYAISRGAGCRLGNWKRERGGGLPVAFGFRFSFRVCLYCSVRGTLWRFVVCVWCAVD